MKLLAAFTASLLAAGCLNWQVPGETQTSGTRMRAVRDRVLEAAAKERPGCRNQKITETRIVDLHPDARVELERWTVVSCGETLNFIVRFPPTGRGTGFVVQHER